MFDIKDTNGEPVQKNMTTKCEVGLAKLLEVAQKMGYDVERKPLEIAEGGYISEISWRVVICSILITPRKKQ